MAGLGGGKDGIGYSRKGWIPGPPPRNDRLGLSGGKDRVGYSRKGGIRFTPPANKLSGEDPDGAPSTPHELAALIREDPVTPE